MASRNLQRMGYRRILGLLIALILVPTSLLLLLGIVLMFVGAIHHNVVLGILILSFVSALITGAVLVMVFVRREANLSELRADFVSKVSHELRTPLTAIRLFAETLERTEEPLAMRTCIGGLNLEVGRLSRRIERLLDWGRMEVGRKIYRRTEECVEAVVQEAVEGFSLLHTDAVDFTYTVDPDLPTVLLDRHAWIDALLNLLTNAYKYGGTPPVIRLRAYLREAHVCLEVSDNGIGIPRLERRRIFEKFYRIEEGPGVAQEGSGLGLAIVEHVVRGHRGKIELESHEAKGSTFRLLLPLGTQSIQGQAGRVP